MSKVLSQQFVQQCQQVLLADQHIVVAYSGGVDSQVLLHLLKQNQQTLGLKTLTAIHINHGISDHAEQWQQFCQQQCQQWQIPFRAQRIALPDPKRNIEAQAREARYQAINTLCQPNEIVVTGHHLDDQAETLLLALKRGAGIKGLAAMSSVGQLPIANDKAIKLVRPLLAFSRSDIERYAQDNKLTWIDDDSNTDTRYDRNFIRQTVMPLLTARWPAIVANMSQSAEHCREADQLMQAVAEQTLTDCQVANNVLAIPSLMALSQAKRKNVIRTWFQQQTGATLSKALLLQLERSLFTAKADANPQLECAPFCLRRYQDKLYLTPVFADLSQWSHQIDWAWLVAETTQALALPDQLPPLMFGQSSIDDRPRFKLNSNQPLTVCFSHHNPTIMPHFRRHSRPLKKVLQELNLPVWTRQRLPLIFAGDQLVAIAGVTVCQPFLAAPGENGVFIDWQVE